MPVNEESLYRWLGARLKRRREELNMTQAELAGEVKLLRTSITNIEAGRQRPPLHLLYDLCAALGLEAADVLPPADEVVRPRTVPIKELVRSRVGGGVKDVPQKTADMLQRLLNE